MNERAPMPSSIANQTTDELGGPGSILVRQRRDHVRLDQLLHKVHSSTGSAQDAALNELARLVFPHAFAEESVLWPLARRVVPEAGALTLEVEQEHQRINELWSDLERLPQESDRRTQVLDELTELLRSDVRDEEDRLLPLLQERLNLPQLRRAGAQWELVRRTAPTRPHAVVARRPPGNVLAALPLTAVDRGRDALDRFARTGRGTRHDVARRVSGGLATLAGRVEHLPGMRRGEDPSTRRARSV